MRIIIIGPTLLTRNCAEAIIRNGKDEIAAIFTLEDAFCRKKSRFALMDDLAADNNIRLFKVPDINEKPVVEKIAGLRPDVIFELGWSQIISPEILKIPEKGCIGVHASLLPKNRGAASLNWAIINGEKKTGVTLFYLAEKPDDGDVIAQKEFHIDDRDDIETLHAKSDLASAELIMENLDAIRSGSARRIKQDPLLATYTQKRKPDDGEIDWNTGSRQIYNWIRAQAHPFPGAFTTWNGKKLYIWKAEIHSVAQSGEPGRIFEVKQKDGILVNTADKMILIRRAQLNSGIEMWADELAERHGIRTGDTFGRRTE